MGNCKHSMAGTEHNTVSTVNVDVTKIVKYSCISSVLIVFIIFTSNTLKHIMQK